MPISSPLRSVPLATMNCIDNISSVESSPHRAPLIRKSSEHPSASATKTPDKQQQQYNNMNTAASTENPSSAKRPKVNKDNEDADTTPTTADLVVIPLVYPTNVLVPSREIVQSLFEESMIQSRSGKTTNDIDTDDNKQKQAQAVALTAETDAGLLSFTQVLLPAAAYCEEQALKQLQAVTQRDYSTVSGATETVRQCRKAIYDGVSAAMRAAQTSRDNRFVVDQQREEAWRQDAADKLKKERDSAEQLQQQEDECRQLELSRQKAELKKKLPRNQELWREVAYLMTEISKLQKEERLWQQAVQNLDAAEQELDRQEQEQLELEQKDQADMDNNTAANNEDNESITTKTATPEIAMVEQTIEDITLSSIRIQQALKIVSGIITESDQVRKDLYRRYRQDHQFHGYPGIKNPKGLLKALSQSQDF